MKLSPLISRPVLCFASKSCRYMPGYMCGFIGCVLVAFMHQSIETLTPQPPGHSGELNINPVLKNGYFPTPVASTLLKSQSSGGIRTPGTRNKTQLKTASFVLDMVAEVKLIVFSIYHLPNTVFEHSCWWNSACALRIAKNKYVIDHWSVSIYLLSVTSVI